MSWTFFTITNLIARPAGIFMTCYLGSGQLIPYHGWGLIVWAVIIVVVGVLLFLSFKYRQQIENFLQTKFKSKKTNPQNVECSEENVNSVSEEYVNESKEEKENKEDIKKDKIDKKTIKK